MNAHFFDAKRVFHATLRVARPLLAEYGLTPARFDLLYAMFPADSRRDTSRSTEQRWLSTVLGVSAATVCRMLKSLETLGFIRRTRSTVDKRRVWVWLTERGSRQVERVLDHLVWSDDLGFAVDCALGEDEWHSEGACLIQKDAAQWVSTRIRRAFGDRATLYYPWHPDD